MDRSWRRWSGERPRRGGNPLRAGRFSAGAKDAVRVDVLLVQLVEEHRLQDAQTVTHRAPEADLRGLVEVARGDGHLAEAHPGGHALGDDFRVEDEVVGVRLEVDR